MKRKPLFLAMAVLLAAGGLWLGVRWKTQRADVIHESDMSRDLKSPNGPAETGEMPNSTRRHAPPDPTRKFRELTPEERVQLARQGPIGG